MGAVRNAVKTYMANFICHVLLTAFLTAPVFFIFWSLFEDWETFKGEVA
jgi:hypothetical protein